MNTLKTQHTPVNVTFFEGIATVEDGTQVEATIELLKAAPDLLAALESLTRAYGAADGRNGNSGECWDLARAAIAKALGQ